MNSLEERLQRLRLGTAMAMTQRDRGLGGATPSPLLSPFRSPAPLSPVANSPLALQRSPIALPAAVPAPLLPVQSNLASGPVSLSVASPLVSVANPLSPNSTAAVPTVRRVKAKVIGLPSSTEIAQTVPQAAGPELPAHVDTLEDLANALGFTLTPPDDALEDGLGEAGAGAASEPRRQEPRTPFADALALNGLEAVKTRVEPVFAASVQRPVIPENEVLPEPEEAPQEDMGLSEEAPGEEGPERVVEEQTAETSPLADMPEVDTASESVQTVTVKASAKPSKAQRTQAKAAEQVKEQRKSTTGKRKVDAASPPTETTVKAEPIPAESVPEVVIDDHIDLATGDFEETLDDDVIAVAESETLAEPELVETEPQKDPEQERRELEAFLKASSPDIPVRLPRKPRPQKRPPVVQEVQSKPIAPPLSPQEAYKQFSELRKHLGLPPLPPPPEWAEEQADSQEEVVVQESTLVTPQVEEVRPEQASAAIEVQEQPQEVLSQVIEAAHPIPTKVKAKVRAVRPVTEVSGPQAQLPSPEPKVVPQVVSPQPQPQVQKAARQVQDDTDQEEESSIVADIPMPTPLPDQPLQKELLSEPIPSLNKATSTYELQVPKKKVLPAQPALENQVPVKAIPTKIVPAKVKSVDGFPAIKDEPEFGHQALQDELQLEPLIPAKVDLADRAIEEAQLEESNPVEQEPTLVTDLVTESSTPPVRPVLVTASLPEPLEATPPPVLVPKVRFKAEIAEPAQPTDTPIREQGDPALTPAAWTWSASPIIQISEPVEALLIDPAVVWAQPLLSILTPQAQGLDDVQAITPLSWTQPTPAAPTVQPPFQPLLPVPIPRTIPSLTDTEFLVPSPVPVLPPQPFQPILPEPPMVPVWPVAPVPPLQAALEQAFTQPIQGPSTLPMNVQSALEKTVGPAVRDIRVIRSPEADQALTLSRADGLALGDTILLPQNLDLDTPDGHALAAHESTHAIKSKQPNFIPASVVRAGKPVANDEESLALAAEHSAFNEFKVASTPIPPTSLPQRPAPQPLSTPLSYASSAPEPSPSWRSTAPEPIPVPSQSSSVPELLPSFSLGLHAASKDRPKPDDKPSPNQKKDESAGASFQAPTAPDLEYLAEVVYKEIKEKLHYEVSRLFG